MATKIDVLCFMHHHWPLSSPSCKAHRAYPCPIVSEVNIKQCCPWQRANGLDDSAAVVDLEWPGDADRFGFHTAPVASSADGKQPFLGFLSSIHFNNINLQRVLPLFVVLHDLFGAQALW